MTGDTDIAALGALLGEPARIRVLLALADGRALPASVLAGEAGVAASTASEHLRKLLDADLVRVETHGRHRYYRIAGPRVARLLELLAEHAVPAPVRSLRQGTRAHALRRARYCYDHLGRRLGVALMAALIDRGVLVGGDGRFDPEHAHADRFATPGRDIDYRLSDHGAQFTRDFGLDLSELTAVRRPLIRYCLDWSEQRHHLAGALGAALARRLFDLRWLRPGKHPRTVELTDIGYDGLQAVFDIDLTDH